MVTNMIVTEEGNYHRNFLRKELTYSLLNGPISFAKFK